ncbi:hypothetical protein [Erythrobacter litoralis]|uniref:hypothetical protein n=1 Tax=Erythrobacter litoralis TaxID=39960 RepID=UPI0003249FC2|nr:hypothetical protein [Erythrobacter litoralis]
MSRLVKLDLFADFFQVYIADGKFRTDTSDIWNNKASDRMLAIAENLIAIGTARNMTVPVSLELLSGRPRPDFEVWEQVIEASFNVPSGEIVALGCTDYLPDAKRLQVSPGSYRALVSYRGLDSLSDDGLDGEDEYRVQLWPDAKCDVRAMKRRPDTVLPRI